MIKNYMESLVSDALLKEFSDSSSKYTNICKCNLCLATIQANALNLLPPFYITNLKGQVYGETQSKEIQHQGDVLVAIASGIKMQLEANPHNGRILKNIL